MGTAHLEVVGPRLALDEGERDSAPREIVLELSRARRTEDPHAWLELRPQKYHLRMGQGAKRSASFPWGKDVLEDLTALSCLEPDPAVARRLGAVLREFLDELDWGGHEETLERELSRGRGPRVVMRLAAAELYSLPWELVTTRDSGQHLADLPGFTLRYEWPRSVPAARRRGTAAEGRVLLAWSEAADAVPDERHLPALLQAARDAGFDFHPRRDVLAKASLSSLDQALHTAENEGRPVSVLHLLCHGTVLGSEASGHYGLVLNASGDRGGARRVDSGTLQAVLAKYRDTLRMVVLCACHGGDASPRASPLGSVAQELHRGGIEMVVASRLPLSSEGSVILARTLYTKLLADSCSLEEALGEVRRRLRVEARGFDWASLQLYARRSGHLDLRPVVLRPYQGLVPFSQENRRFFFGRERLEATLLARVREAVSGQRPRFQVVAGASGAGKSSVVRAGLIPRLPPEAWDVVEVRPCELVGRPRGTVGVHSEALRELLHRLHRVWDSEPLPDDVRAEPRDVLAEARRLRQVRAERRLLLVVDQLEEVFIHLGAEERQSVMQVLWALSCERELGCVVVATMRVDSFERCGEVLLDDVTRLDAVVYSELHRVFVAQLRPEELTEVIVKPARRVGLELEAGLVERLCRDVGQEPGALPLLEHTLDLLWQGREGHRLTHATYERMEGVAGSLTQTAERLYEALEDGEHEQVRRLGAELVALGEETTPDSRRRVWLDDLRPVEPKERSDFDRVLEKLVDQRLVIRGGDAERGGRVWLEVAHEALIRRWPRLRGWLRSNRTRLLQWRELRAMAETWQAHRGDADDGRSYLATGERLAGALRIRREHERQPTAVVREFLLASERHERQQLLRHWMLLAGLVTGLGVCGGMALDLGAQRDALGAQRDALESRLREAGTLARRIHYAGQSLSTLGTEREELLRQVEGLLLHLGAASESGLQLERISRHLHDGDAAMARGDAAKAYADYSQAFQRATRLRTDQPESVLYQSVVGTLHSKLGETALKQGQFKEALRHYEAHRELLEGLLKEDPTNEGFWRELNDVESHLKALDAKAP
ncbi:CHAT domain-containing protein [Pyxidicoccus parkwayensis]|uniref:CHAT domain-containing protein n=1 Tax=Pyxidicoccus parkwayensis TaxID=2813578 RepID=A0ABX7NMB2_9BACT|nr:CHAT domain-containing protein [Pyxidicoccus parkwaysis]QSQ19910.1 CHAT domain-containing protein [Pyxidicoccus parkwaysis]